MIAQWQSSTIENKESTLRIGALRFRVHHLKGNLPPILPDRATLADAIDVVLREVLDPADPSYWVVQRLHLPFRSEAKLGVNELVEAFSKELRTAVYRILSGEIVEGIWRYASRAHWLADCLWAQACGTASTQWQFGRYQHLASLPAGDAVRLTLAQESETGLEALAILTEQQRIRPFCDRIGDSAARAILKLLLPEKTGQDSRADNNMRRLLFEERRAVPHRRYTPYLVAIARYYHSYPGHALPNIAKLVKEPQQDLSTNTVSSVTDTQQTIDLQGFDSPATQNKHASSPTLTINDDAHLTTSSVDQIANDIEVIETGFAGVFLLWRSVIEMDLLSLLPEGDAAGASRLALAAALTGPDFQAAWNDPALHWLCGYKPNDDQLAPAPPEDLSRRFVAHFVDWRFPRPVEPMLTQAGRVHVLQDQNTEDWLAIGNRRSCCSIAKTLKLEPEKPNPNTRDPRIDLQWFSVAQRRARRGWALLARAAYADFARRLHGLEKSNAAWLWDKLLAGWGVLEPGAPSIMVLAHAQLDLVLRMTGIDGTLIDTPGGPVRLQLPVAY